MISARIAEPTPAALAEAVALLRRGGVVGMPTETVYGLAGDATNPEALARIFAVKERPTFDPLIVHVLDEAGSRSLRALDEAGVIQLGGLTDRGRAIAEELAGAFWPGPLTLVLPKGARIPLLATSGLDTVAVRAPRHAVARALIGAFGGPLAAPSANRFGRISPTSASDVVAELGDRIELVLDGQASQVGVESTVVHVGGGGELTLLRPGGVPAAEIERRAGSMLAVPVVTPAGAAPAPGMLASHYAPRKALHLLDAPLTSGRWESATWPREQPLPAKVGLLAATGDVSEIRASAQRLGVSELELRVLSARGDSSEAARHLFAHLRALDGSGAEVLFAEPWPAREGLGHAIADRLRRAAVKASPLPRAGGG